MATLEAGSRIDNQEKSVNDYIKTHLVTGLGLTVYYVGEQRDDDDPLPVMWVDADIIQGSPVRPVNHAPGLKLEVYRESFLNLNCFRIENPALYRRDIYALSTMADNVRELFEVGTVIPVYDYDTVGKPWAGALTIESSPEIRRIEVPSEDQVSQINISISLMHHSVFG